MSDHLPPLPRRPHSEDGQGEFGYGEFGQGESSYGEFGYGVASPHQSGDADALVTFTRRQMLQGLAAAGLAGLGGYKLYEALAEPGDGRSGAADGETAGSSDVLKVPAAPAVAAGDPAMASSQTLRYGQPAPVDQRVLVLIELDGGNDGLSTVVPYQSGVLHDLRGGLALDGALVHRLDDEVGLAPSLERLSKRQYAVVEGVGPVEGVLSHFAMANRWEMGDLTGRDAQRSGFLGRVADALDVGAPLTGLSVAGYTPRFSNARSSVLSVENLSQFRVLTADKWIYRPYRDALRTVSGGPMASKMAESWNELFAVGDALGEFERPDENSEMIEESRKLGVQLAIASIAIRAQLGVRVIHARLGGFDTHKYHAKRHSQLLSQLDVAIDGFLSEMEAAGLADRVLVATSSEFGRRARPNGTGLDHGAASSMLLFGPVRPGRYGEPSPLTDLDGFGNFKTTVPFDRYLATLAEEWLGVEAGSVLPNTPAGLSIFA